MWILLMCLSVVLPEAAIVIVVWVLHRRRQRRFGDHVLPSLAAEMVGHCMNCGRRLRQGIGYCDLVCRHGYERRFIGPR